MRSLRERLGVALAVVALVSVAVTAAVAVGLLRSYALTSARADLRRVAQALLLESEGAGIDDRSLRPAVRRLLRVNGDLVVVVGPDGSLFGDDVAAAREIDAAPLLSGSAVEGTVSTGDGDFVYVGLPARFGRGRSGGVVLLRPVAVARDLMAPAVSRIAIAGILALLGAVGISALVARRLTRPVQSLSDAAHRIAAGDLVQSVPVEGDDELGELARAFNRMSSALSEAQRREREFLASVSHELRTPITSIRGYAEAIEDGAVRDEDGRAEALAIIRAESARLERMVQDVMDLARLGAREFALEIRPANLSTVVGETVAAHGAEAAAAGVTLNADAPEEVRLATDPDRVRQVVSNLVQNALRVTPAGGTVTVRAAATGSGAAIEVADTGPGIAPEDLPHVFERAYLWRASRGERPVGTGLGLAIVRELVRALGGRVGAASRPGEGSSFRVELPATPPPPRTVEPDARGG